MAGYRDAMRTFAQMGNLGFGTPALEVDALFAELRDQIKKRMSRRAEHTVSKARTRDSMAAAAKLTTLSTGSRESSPIHR